MFGFFIFIIAFNLFCSLSLMDEYTDNVWLTILLGAVSGIIFCAGLYIINQVFWGVIDVIYAMRGR